MLTIILIIAIIVIITLLIYLDFVKKELKKEAQKDIEKILLKEYFKTKIINIKEKISEISQISCRENKLEFINNLEKKLKEVEKENNLRIDGENIIVKFKQQTYKLEAIEKEIAEYIFLEREEQIKSGKFITEEKRKN